MEISLAGLGYRRIDGAAGLLSAAASPFVVRFGSYPLRETEQVLNRLCMQPQAISFDSSLPTVLKHPQSEASNLDAMQY